MPTGIYKRTKYHGEKISRALKGRVFSDEHRRKISLIAIQQNRQLIHNKSHSEETKKKISESRKGITTDEKHHMWKGNKVSYRSLHKWVERKLGKPKICQFCKSEELKGHNIHWANKTGEYKRIITDWIRLCASCHGAYDRKLNQN